MSLSAAAATVTIPTSTKVAALFVERGGVYWGLDDVDPWDESRDARLYAGPHPVVAHSPCQRWGRYWHGGPSAKVRRIKGDDGGCFAAALAAVRRWGGVLEHPADSSAWDAYGLFAPTRSGGWLTAGDWQGWTCCVEQGHYGHRARKATWLYARRCGVARSEVGAVEWQGPPRRRIPFGGGTSTCRSHWRVPALERTPAQGHAHPFP